MSVFSSRWNEINSRLEKDVGESPLLPNGFISLRLYTGPMYAKYNGVLRGLPPKLDQQPEPDFAER